MSYVKATPVRVGKRRALPAWVEVHLKLADSTVAALFDQPPIFESGNLLRPDASHCIVPELACQIDTASTQARARSG